MNFLQEILAFRNWALVRPINACAQALWFWLMCFNNDLAFEVDGVWYWPVEFTVPNSTLASALNISRQQLDLMRNLLIQSGRIEYKKGKGSKSGIYRMIPFGANYLTQTLTQPLTQSLTQVWTQTGHTHLINNKYINNNYSGGGEESSRACVRDPVENSLDDYLGMTDALKSQTRDLAYQLFRRYFGRSATEHDAYLLFGHISGNRPTANGGWEAWIDSDKVSVAEYAFATASRAGANRWNYLESVFARCSSRGLTTRDACEQYDTDRAWAQEHGGEPSGT